MPGNETIMQLTSDREIVIERTFNAPPRLVFDAWTKPEFVKRWWAPKGLGVAMVSCEADVRVGGKYRYVIKPARFDAVAFSGEYSEITPYSRLVYTQFFEPMRNAGAVVVSVSFEDLGDRTHLISHELYPSKEAREAALSSGMEQGMRQTMDQLDELVASLI
ncbi:MAG: SRPBCC family protein [Myxococcales bacterium]